MKQKTETGMKEFLIREVLLHASDTLPADTEKRLSEIRRDKPSVPVIYVASGSAAIIAGSTAAAAAARLYVEEMGIR